MSDLFPNLPQSHSGAILADLAANPASSLELGKAAEHLVCADLILQGYRAYLSDQGLPYDLVADLDGRLIRIQVKASCFSRNMNMSGRSESLGYSFYVRRRGKGGSKRLSAEDCDIVAMIALDIRVIAYLPLGEVGQTCQLMPPKFAFKGKYKRSRVVAIDGLPFARAIERLPE